MKVPPESKTKPPQTNLEILRQNLNYFLSPSTPMAPPQSNFFFPRCDKGIFRESAMAGKPPREIHFRRIEAQPLPFRRGILLEESRTVPSRVAPPESIVPHFCVPTPFPTQDCRSPSASRLQINTWRSENSRRRVVFTDRGRKRLGKV